MRHRTVFAATPAYSLVRTIAWVYLASVISISTTASANETSIPDGQSKTPISAFLNPDGTLKSGTGFTGSLDMSGYRLVTGESGEPRFMRTSIPKAPGEPILNGPEPDDSDSYWDAQFSSVGPNGPVDAILVAPDGNIYIGGDFSAIGTVEANHIAGWDGSTWFPLGSGMSAPVACLAWWSGNLYAGGYFTKAGGVMVNLIAKWNGVEWSSLAGGVNGSVLALAAYGSGIYAGGQFVNAGGTTVSRVARWNGTTWFAMGSGTNGTVNALLPVGSQVYVGGTFTQAGGIGAGNIARFDGTSWYALGTGTSTTVNALTLDSSGTLIAGGSFLSAGGVPARGVAAWNGTNWQAMGDGILGPVLSLFRDGDVIYAGGDIFGSGTESFRSVARWDGSTWSTIDGPGLDGRVAPRVYTIAKKDTKLFFGGIFSGCGTAQTRADNMVGWTGTSWESVAPVTSGVDHNVYALASDGAKVYVGGHLNYGGSTRKTGILTWDGANWAKVGSGDGVSMSVRAIALSGSSVYIGGDFAEIDGVAAGNVACWDGTAWSGMSGGVNGTVYALCAEAGAVYVGGNFSTAGGLPAPRIAKWDGTTWTAMSTGMDDDVYALAADATYVYAGGSFDMAGGTPVDGIARWDGGAWQAMGSGVDGVIRALAVGSYGRVYAGGYFLTAGGVPANNVAVWNGAAWAPLGDGLGGDVNGLAVATLLEVTSRPNAALPPPLPDYVYACGTFTEDGAGVPMNRVAVWHDSSWSPCGSGLNGDAYAIARCNNALVVGGLFEKAGSSLSHCLAVWQPRVNKDSTTMSSPAITKTRVGNNRFGFFKPALTPTLGGAISYDGGMPVTVTLNRASEIRVADTRVNGAFTLQPEGVRFHSGANLHIEFSEDDATSFSKPWNEFRAVRMTYPVTYPTSREAASVELLSDLPPKPERIENGRQIYSFDIPVAEIASTYGAVPRSHVPGPAVYTWYDDDFSTDVTNPVPGGTTGWTPMSITQTGQATDYDVANEALRVTISSSTAGPRINGWVTANSEWLPYSSVKSNSYVRSKFHVFSQGATSDLNTIPNMRLRTSTRFAVNSMLEVFNHLAGDITGTNAGRELRPSSDPTSPSVYRVDFDPIDVPALDTEGEGISRGFEAYSLESQEQGSIELAESTIGTYPASLLPNTGVAVLAEKVYALSSSDAGDLKVFNSLTDGPFMRKFVLVAPGILGSEVALDGVTDPTYTENESGITLDSTAVASNRFGLAVREFTEMGDNSSRIRVEPGRQYKIRFHVVSETNSNRNPQLRLRARAIKFMWSQKLEIGGALAAGTTNNSIAQQALPGAGSANPDKLYGQEPGGWYTMLMHTPMSTEIRGSQPVISAQPGPGSASTSIRDIKLGFDLIDTLSGMAPSTQETGHFTLGRVELRAYELLSD